MSLVTRPTLSICTYLLLFIGFVQASFVRESRWQELNHNRRTMRHVSSICILLNVACDEDVTRSKENILTKINHHELKSGFDNKRSLKHLNSNLIHNHEGRKIPTHADFYNVPYVLKRRRRRLKNAVESAAQETQRDSQLIKEKNNFSEENINNVNLSSERTNEPNILLQMMLKINMKTASPQKIKISDLTQPIEIQSTSSVVQLHTAYPEPVFQLPKDATSTAENKEIYYSDGPILSKISLDNTRHIIENDKPADLSQIINEPTVFYTGSIYLLTDNSNTQYQLHEYYTADSSSALTSTVNLNNHNNLVFFSDEQSTKHLEEGTQQTFNANHLSHADYKSSTSSTSENNTKLHTLEEIESNILFYTNIALNNPNTLLTHSFQPLIEPHKSAKLNNAFVKNYRNSKYISPTTVLSDSFKPVYDFDYRENRNCGFKNCNSFSTSFNSERELHKAERTEDIYLKQKTEYLPNFLSINEEHIKSSLVITFEKEFLHPSANFKFPERTPSLPWHKLQVTRSVTEAPVNSDSIVIDSSLLKTDNSRKYSHFYIKNTKLFSNTILETKTSSLLSSATVESRIDIINNDEPIRPSMHNYKISTLNRNLLKFSIEQSVYEENMAKEAQNRTRIIKLNTNSKSNIPSPTILIPHYSSFVISSAQLKSKEFHATFGYPSILKTNKFSPDPSKSFNFEYENSSTKAKLHTDDELIKTSYNTMLIGVTKASILFQSVHKTFSITNSEQIELNNYLSKNFVQNGTEAMRVFDTLKENTFTILTEYYASPRDEVEPQSLKVIHWSSKTDFIEASYKNIGSYDSDNSATQMPVHPESLEFLGHSKERINIYATPTWHMQTEPISSEINEISFTNSDIFSFDAIEKNFPSTTLKIAKSTVINPSKAPTDLSSKKYEFNASQRRQNAEIFKAENPVLDSSIYQSSKFMLTEISDSTINDISTSSTFYDKFFDEMVTATIYYLSKQGRNSNEGISYSDSINSTNKDFNRTENNSDNNNINDISELNNANLRNESFLFMENEAVENADGSTEDNMLFDFFNFTNKNLIRTERDISDNTESDADEIKGYEKAQLSNRKLIFSNHTLVENNASATSNSILHETTKSTVNENSFENLTTDTNKSAVNSLYFEYDARETTTDFVGGFLDFTRKGFKYAKSGQPETTEMTLKHFLQSDASNLTYKNAVHFVDTDFQKSHKRINDNNITIGPQNYAPINITHTDSDTSGSTASATNEMLSNSDPYIINLTTENSDDVSLRNDESITDNNFLLKSFNFTDKNLVDTELNLIEETEVSTNDISRIPATNVSNENITVHHKFAEDIMGTGFKPNHKKKIHNHTKHNILEDSDKTDEVTSIFNATTFSDKTELHSKVELSSLNVTDADMTFDPFRFSDERLVRTERDLFRNVENKGNGSSQVRISMKEKNLTDIDFVSNVTNLENKIPVGTEYAVLGNSSDITPESSSIINEASFSNKNIMHSEEDILRNNYSVTETVVKLDQISFEDENLEHTEHDVTKNIEINANVSLNFSDEIPMFSQRDFSGNDSITNASLVASAFTSTENTIRSSIHDTTGNNIIINNSISGINLINLTEQSTMRSFEISPGKDDSITESDVVLDPFSFTEDNITESNVLLGPFSYTDKSIVRTERDLSVSTENARDLSSSINTQTDLPESIHTLYGSFNDNDKFNANNLKKSFTTERNLLRNTQSAAKSTEFSLTNSNEDNNTEGNVLLDLFSYTETSVETTEQDSNVPINLLYLPTTTTDPAESIQTHHGSLDDNAKFHVNNLKKSIPTERTLFENTEPSDKSTEDFSGIADNIDQADGLLNPVNNTYERTERDLFENTENTRELNSAINLPDLPDTVTDPPESLQTQQDSFYDNDELNANNLKKNFLTESNLLENTESSASESVFDLPDTHFNPFDREEFKSTESPDLNPVNVDNGNMRSTESENSDSDTIGLKNEIILTTISDDSERDERFDLDYLDLANTNIIPTEQPTTTENDEQEQVNLNTVDWNENNIPFNDPSLQESTEIFDLESAVLLHTSEKCESSGVDISDLTDKSIVSSDRDTVKVTKSFEFGADDFLNKNISADRNVLKNNESSSVINSGINDLANISSTELNLFKTILNDDISTDVINDSSPSSNTTSFADKEIIRTEREIVFPEEDIPDILLPAATETSSLGTDEEDEDTSLKILPIGDIFTDVINNSSPNFDTTSFADEEIIRTEREIVFSEETVPDIRLPNAAETSSLGTDEEDEDTSSQILPNANISTDVINYSSPSSDTTSFLDKEVIRTEREIVFPEEDIPDVLLPNAAETSSLGTDDRDEDTSSKILPIKPVEQSYHDIAEKDTLIPKTTNFEMNNRPSTEFGLGVGSSESTNVSGKKDSSYEPPEKQPPNVVEAENPDNRAPDSTVGTKSEHPPPEDDVAVNNIALKPVLNPKDSIDGLDITESESNDQETLFGENSENTDIELNAESSFTIQTNYDPSTEKLNKSKRDKPENSFSNDKEKNSTVRKIAEDFIPKQENSDGYESIGISTTKVSIDQSTIKNDADFELNIASSPATLQHSFGSDRSGEDVYQEQNHQTSSKPLHTQADVSPDDESLFNLQYRPTDQNSFTRSTDPEFLTEDQYEGSNQEPRVEEEEDESDYDEPDASKEQSTASLEQSTDGFTEDLSQGTSKDDSNGAGINSNSAENGAATEANGKSDVSTVGTTESSIVPFHFTIDADYDEIVGSNKTEFEASLSKQLGVAMRVPLECVQNLRVSKGSIEVNFDLVPNADYGHLADETALKKAADELKRMIDSGQLTINDLKGNTLVVIPIDPPTQPPSASDVEHTSLILGVVIGAFILTVIMVAITAIIVKRKNSGDQRLTPIEEARSKLPSYREIPFQEALFVKEGANKFIFGKYNYDTGRWLGPGPEPRPFEPPNSVVYRPPTDSEIRQTPRPTTAVRERLKNEWELDWDSLVSSR